MLIVLILGKRFLYLSRRFSWHFSSKGLFFFLLLFCLLLFYFVLRSSLLDESEGVSFEGRDEFFGVGMDVAHLLLGFAGTGFSFSDNFSLGNSVSVIEGRISQYGSVVDRLILDDDIRDLEISPFYLYLYFLNSMVSADDGTVVSLLERPFRRRLWSLIGSGEESRKRRMRNIYASFLTRDSILRGYRFLRKNRVLLDRMERLYGVPKEYLVSILFVETQLGQVTGDHFVLNVYNTLYHYDHKNLLGKKSLVVRDIVDDGVEELFRVGSSGEYSAIYSLKNFIFPSLGELGSLPISSGGVNFSMERLEEGVKYVSSDVYYNLASYVKRKQEWGYEQLKSLIVIDFLYGIDTHSLQGSWAGAFGYCQFIPSSYIDLGRDGNGDGVIDLFVFDDAFASTGHYLSESGFEGGDKRKIRSAIYRYNFSTDYVNTVYNYANILARVVKRGFRKGFRRKGFRRLRRTSFVKKRS